MEKMKECKEIEKLLISIDMVNGFVKEGNMADSYIQHIVPEHIKLIKQIQEKGGMIAFVKECHKENCREFNQYPAHCIEGTEEAELIDELKPFEKDAFVYLKNSTSMIYAPNFLQDIDKMTKLKEIIIVGCCTDICILNSVIPLQNYFDQKDREVKVIVPKNAVETYEGPNHKREEYNELAFKLMTLAGIHLVENLAI